MDGLLVIDRLGRTNDPFIQAGGSVTTYQRRLGAADMDHPYYSAIEVGHKVSRPSHVGRVPSRCKGLGYRL